MRKLKGTQKGFTLIEMMVVIVIIGIIAALAYPSYQRYIMRAHRVDARNMLQEIAQRLEQNFSATRRYDQDNKSTPDTIDDAMLAAWGMSQSPSSGDVRYNISFSVVPTETTYTLQAVPVGAQADDECGTFTLNQSNLKTADGEGGRAEISRRCWSQ